MRFGRFGLHDFGVGNRVDDDIRRTKKADWRGNMFKEREVRRAIARHISDPALVEMIFDLAHKQHEY